MEGAGTHACGVARRCVCIDRIVRVGALSTGRIYYTVVPTATLLTTHGQDMASYLFPDQRFPFIYGSPTGVRRASVPPCDDGFAFHGAQVASSFTYDVATDGDALWCHPSSTCRACAVACIYF